MKHDYTINDFFNEIDNKLQVLCEDIKKEHPKEIELNIHVKMIRDLFHAVRLDYNYGYEQEQTDYEDSL
jgi:hypothetical protein